MNDNRKKLAGILKILYEMTDEDHSLDTYQLIDEMETMGFGRADRKTIEPNIRFLSEDAGFDIIKEKGSPNRYKLVGRTFELAELKMLADAVQSSRFISNKKSAEIISKLKHLASRYQAEKLERNIVTNNSFKREGSTALYNIDVINDAIKERKCIGFRMVDYDMSRKPVERHGGREYDVSPYALIWNNDYYYMLGKSAGEENVRSYRIDRMRAAHVLDKTLEQAPADFNLERYSGRIFDMFTGDAAEVVLDCKDYTINYLIDRLGNEFKSEKTADDRFRAQVTVDVGPTFYAWVFQFCGDIRIIGPERVRREYEEMLSTQLEGHAEGK